MGHYTSKVKKGFTIIEVMIVLAIAGLIMLIVLIAIPQLQRNQRNSARKDIAGRVKTEIDNYAANNNGAAPDATTLAGFNTRYLTGVNINDPRESTTFAPVISTQTNTNGAVVGRLDYRLGYVCNGEAIVAGGGRQYALFTQLEGGAIFCLDNK